MTNTVENHTRLTTLITFSSDNILTPKNFTTYLRSFTSLHGILPAKFQPAATIFPVSSAIAAMLNHWPRFDNRSRGLDL